MKPSDFYFIKANKNTEDYETSSIETAKSGNQKKKVKIVSMSLPNNSQIKGGMMSQGKKKKVQLSFVKPASAKPTPQLSKSNQSIDKNKKKTVSNFVSAYLSNNNNKY